jgi:hypothetical protein
MAIQWLDYDGYLAAVDPMSAERAGAAPAPPAPPDVQYVNDLAGELDFSLLIDPPDGPEWTIVAGAAIVGTTFVLGLGALCIIGAVAVARWLGWVA